MSEILKGDLIGVHEQKNGETNEEFVGLSFRLTGNAIGTANLNAPEAIEALKKRFEEAKTAGEGLIFEIRNATPVVATEKLEDGSEVPVVRGSTRYYRLAAAEVDARVGLKLVGTVPRGAAVTLEL